MPLGLGIPRHRASALGSRPRLAPRHSKTQLAAVVTLALAALAGGHPAGAQIDEPETLPSSIPLAPEIRSAAIADLDSIYQEWLKSVRGLITWRELDYFLRLPEDFRRDAFMEAFWKPRDPEPRTPVNELQQRWQVLLDSVGGIHYGDSRFLLLLLNGAPGGWTLPDGRPVSRCLSKGKALEIWFYGRGERNSRRLPVILVRRMTGGPYEPYRQGDNLWATQRAGRLPTADVRMLCSDEDVDYALSEIARISGYDHLLEGVLAPPLPSPEWLANFSASATDLPRGAETFEVEVELGYPARNQSRTAVQAMLGVPRAAAPGQTFGGELYHNFEMVGEILRDGQLFESFRYSFEGPTPEDTAILPIGFTRYLRPGPANLRILVEDLYSGRFARVEREIDVPSPAELPAAPQVAAQLVDGADKAPTLRLLKPSGDLHTGLVRFRARAAQVFERVEFYVDERQVLTKHNPPYSVELDLGPAPRPRRVRVVGFVDGRETATDQVWLNQETRSFRVRLVEPRPGGIYPGAATARAEVETPDGQPPHRLEILVNDQPVATLTEPPFVHSLRLPGAGADGQGAAAGELAVLRAVAYLADGSWVDDTVVVNASPFADTVDVRLVELHPLVTGADGRPLIDLERDHFRVFEDGVEQRIARFEHLHDLPVRAALLIDRSASMEAHLDRVTRAAQAFKEAAIDSPSDRVAILSFADDLTLDAGFHAGEGAAERALAGLDARGGTALYDSLVQAFNTFDGARGSTALVLFSDGQDEASRMSFDQALDGARRAGITLYSIGLEAAFTDPKERRAFEDLAAETGGRAYFLDDLGQLSGVYDQILGELRSRYLIAYQPARVEEGSFRSLRLEVQHPGARVLARRGYTP